MSEKTLMNLIGRVKRVIYTSSLGCFDHANRETEARWSVVQMQVSALKPAEGSAGTKRPATPGVVNRDVTVRGPLTCLSGAQVQSLWVEAANDDMSLFDLQGVASLRFQAGGCERPEAASVENMVGMLSPNERGLAERAFAALMRKPIRDARRMPCLQADLVRLVRDGSRAVPLRCKMADAVSCIERSLPQRLKTHARGILAWCLLIDGVLHVGCDAAPAGRVEEVERLSEHVVYLLRVGARKRLPAICVGKAMIDKIGELRVPATVIDGWDAAAAGFHAAAPLAQYNACRVFVRWMRAAEACGGVVRLVPVDPDDEDGIRTRIERAMVNDARGTVIVTPSAARADQLGTFGMPQQVVTWRDFTKMHALPAERRPTTIIVDSAHTLGYGQVAVVAKIAGVSVQCVEFVGCPALLPPSACWGMAFSELCAARGVPFQMSRRELHYTPAPLRRPLAINATPIVHGCVNPAWLLRAAPHTKGQTTDALLSMQLPSTAKHVALVLPAGRSYNRVVDEALYRATRQARTVTVNYQSGPGPSALDNDYAHVGFYGPGVLARNEQYVPLLEHTVNMISV